MPRKVSVVKPTVTVMESLSNAVNMFQMPNLNMLATDNNISLPFKSVDAGALNKGRQDPNRGTRGMTRPGTIMCPW